MNKVVHSLFFAGLIFISNGCSSSGFNRGALQEQVGVVAPSYDDNEIKEAYNKKSNLPKPFKLAVYFKTPPERAGTAGWRWTAEDKAVFESTVKELKSSGVVSDVFPILNSLVNGEDVRALRLAAAKHRADAILVISGAAEIDRSINNWGWSYVLLLPTLFVPGSQADILFLSQATLWDVKNEFLYLTAEAEATSTDTYIAVFGKRDRDLIDTAKTKALAKLNEELKKMVQGSKL